MKFIIFVAGLAILAVTSAEPQRNRNWPPRSTGPTRPGNPFGGHRFRRSPDPADNGFSATWSKPLDGPERRPSYNLDYKYNFVDKNRGSIGATVGAQKLPGQRFEPTVGIQGQWRFRREANPQNSFSTTWSKPLDGPERRPSYNLDYKYNFVDKNRGSIGATVGAQKLPGQRFEPTVGIQGQWRFRREANPQNSFSTTWSKPLDGPERRPSYNLDYKYNFVDKNRGSIGATVGAQKLPGQRFEPTVGIQGQWRFRREANPQNSFSTTWSKPLDGPERRPSYNLDYKYNFVDKNRGSIGATVGAQKLPGQRFEPTVGIQGQWRFRREANPQNSFSTTWSKPLDGPERRPSYNLDYKYNFVDKNRGSIGATVGAQKLPGQRFEPTVGIQGQWRFRREANPQNSFSTTWSKPLDGPERRPSYNLDYKYNFVDKNRGSIGATVGAQKLPGQRFEPTVGIQGQWRFRREANPQNSFSTTWSKPLDGPERRPSYNLDYKYNFVDKNRGSIGATVGAQKLPGQRFEPTVGIQGQWRFRREADLEDIDEAADIETEDLDLPLH